MEFLGIGAPELIFILLIAIIVLGPKDMQKAGQTIGRWLNQLVRSEGWRALQQTSREIRKLPTTLMREANVGWQETEQAIRQGLDTDPKRSADLRRSRTNEIENTIQPPPPKPQIQETDEDNGGDESERHD
jgi:Sec-independent protein secretion pathway components